MPSWARNLAIIVAIALVWEVSARTLNLRFVFPPLSLVLGATIESAASGFLFLHITRTFWRVGVSLGAAAVIVFAIGKLMQSWEGMRQVLKPVLSQLAMAPLIVFAPLMVLFFGLADLSKISAAFLCALFPMLNRIDIDLDRPLRTRTVVAANWNQPVRAMAAGSYIASAPIAAGMPIMGALRVGFQYAFATVLITEMLASAGGLGFLIAESWQLFNVTMMYAAILVVLVLSALALSLLSALEQFVSPAASH